MKSLLILPILLALLTPSCGILGPQADDLTTAQNAVIDTLQEITADGLVTVEEQVRLDTVMAAYFDARDAAGSGFDWTTFLAAVGAALGPGGVLLWSLINGYRNAREKNIGQPLRAPPINSKEPVIVSAATAEKLEV